MKKIRFFGAIFGALLLAFTGSMSFAGEVDVLIKKLVEKGILNRDEAKELLIDMQKESSRQKNAVKEEAKKVAKETAKKEVKSASFELPKWVKDTKIKGDIRIRHQKEDRDNNSGTDNRDRTRIRVRVGLETKVNDQWKAGIGLASGGSDPRSTNQTLENTFDTPDIRLDYGYAEYKPCKYATLVGGKFKNPLWKTKDLLWDGDIRPEGVALKTKYKPMKGIELWATPAYFILESIAGTADPNMVLLQAGIKYKASDMLYFKFAPTIYKFNKVKGNDFTANGGWGRGTNSEDANGNWLFDHNAWALDAEIGANLGGPVPFLGVFGQYVMSEADKSEGGVSSRYGKKDNKGWLAGFKFGHKKIKKFGQWQAKYNYRRLENDAWPDWLPDSDCYGGRTNIKGNEYEVEFGLHKNVIFHIDYYDVKPIQTNAVGFGGGLADQDEKVFQAELLLKW